MILKGFLKNIYYILFFFPNLISAQDFFDDGPDPPPSAPIDNGILFIMLIGIVYAFYLNTNKLNKIIISIKKFFLFIIFSSLYSKAQVINKGIIYIGNDSELYLKSDVFYFQDSQASTITTRSNGHNGVLSYSANSSWLGASNSNYVDGYVKRYGSSSFVFPVCQSGVYAPVKVTSINSESFISSAFYYSNPLITISPNIASSLAAVSNVEYWKIESNPGNSSIISLSWRNSSSILSLCGGVLDNLTIVGYDGDSWNVIPSSVDNISILGAVSDFSLGSISSNSVINLHNYTAFSIGVKQIDCLDLIASSGIIKRWNGSWIPSAPTLADPVAIDIPYNGSLSCNSLELNANVTIENGQYVEIVNNVTGNGKIILSSESSLVQRNNNAIPPRIELNKLTRLMKRYDYIYWGTPIQGNFLSQISEAKALSATLANAFDSKYKYITGSGWVNLDEITTGKGFITRVKNQSPFTSSVVTDKIMLTFAGFANNGDISVPVSYDPLAPNSSKSYELLANPYPCSIDAEKFLVNNTDIDGSIYLWTSSIPFNGVSYTNADYAVWNLSGSVNTSPINQSIDGKIASGQGFRVKALTPSGNITFTNCMRLKTGNDNFFKTSVSTVERYRLTMTNDNGVFSQILIAYLPNATYGYDRLYDAGRNSVNSEQFYSVLNNSKLAINGRPSFIDSDVVQLGISKLDTSFTIFTISIQNTEGIFANGNVKVYIHDKLLGTYNDLGLGSYTFTTSSLLLNDRFEIVYQDSSLSTETQYENNVVCSLSNDLFYINSKIGIEEIKFYDITGRLIQSNNGEGKLNINFPFYHSQGIYIVKFKLNDGRWISNKLINS